MKLLHAGLFSDRQQLGLCFGLGFGIFCMYSMCSVTRVMALCHQSWHAVVFRGDFADSVPVSDFSVVIITENWEVPPKITREFLAFCSIAFLLVFCSLKCISGHFILIVLVALLDKDRSIRIWFLLLELKRILQILVICGSNISPSLGIMLVLFLFNFLWLQAYAE